jgi:class 3 adenylate cyclase
VTFLFTDIEGSTVLWQRHHREMPAVIAAHDRLIRSTVEDHGGYVFTTAGDSFSVAFSSPVDAARAALECQRLLAEHDWGPVGEVRVRMALDAGLVDQRDGDYFGPPVNRVARIMGEASGGEIFLSGTMADLLRHQLPMGYRVAEIGRKRLRGVERPVVLFRLDSEEVAKKPRWRRAALATLGAVAAAGIVWTASGIVTADGADDDALSPTSTVEEAPSAPAAEQVVADGSWDHQVGQLVTAPLVVGNYLIVATPETLVAYDRASGTEAWSNTSFAGASDQITGLATDGAYVLVTTRTRFDVLHPTSGEPVPTCGFFLPEGFARMAASGTQVFLMQQTLYRIGVTPGEPLCHDSIDGAFVVDAGASSAGPVITGSTVVVANSVAIVGIDRATLAEVWRYPDDSSALQIQTPALAAEESEIRLQTGVATRTFVAAGEGTGLLTVLRIEDNEPEAIAIPPRRIDLDRPILISDNAFIAVDNSGDLVGLDRTTGAELWAEPGPATSGPVLSNGMAVVGTPTGLVSVDPLDGTQTMIAEVEQPAWLTVAPGSVITVDARGVLRSHPVSGSPEPPPWEPPPPIRKPNDSENAARIFIEAWNQADLNALEAAASPDLKVNGVPRWDSRWVNVSGWLGHDAAIEATWEIQECTLSEDSRTDRYSTGITCQATYTDAAMQTAGDDPAVVTTTFRASNGVVVYFVDDLQSLSFGGRGYGEHWTRYLEAKEWIEANFPDESPCSDLARERTKLCGEFIAAHLNEWAATLDS